MIVRMEERPAHGSGLIDMYPTLSFVKRLAVKEETDHTTIKRDMRHDVGPTM
jgi:hypothetical protein